MRIIIDAMGGDHAPKAIVEGAIAATKEMDHEILLIGDEEAIISELAAAKYKGDQIAVMHASEVIGNHEAPVRADIHQIVVSLRIFSAAGGCRFLTQCFHVGCTYFFQTFAACQNIHG